MSKLKKMIEWKDMLTIIPSSVGIYGEDIKITYVAPFVFGIRLGDGTVRHNPRVERIDVELASILENLLESRAYGQYLLHEDRKVRDFTKQLMIFDQNEEEQDVWI